jgi:hypothetical protein
LTARAAAITAVIALLPASLANAATVTLEYEPPIPEIEPEPAYTLAVDAAPGETNRLRVARDGDGFLVRDEGAAALIAGPRCAIAGPGLARCPLPGGARHVSAFVRAGDGNDAVALGPLSGLDVAEVLGGSGSDVIAGHTGPDLLDGGRGADMIAGNDGDDRIDGGADADLLDGGPGRDLITYASHTRPVRADLAAGRGGSRGEGDRLFGFEDLAGGSGSDRLYGDARSNLLYGGISGRRDAGHGRGGDDTITLRGRAVGGAGDDVVDAERVACGKGRDVAFRQRFLPTGPYPRDCERMRRFFYVVTRPRLGRRKLVVRFACPIRACRGSVAVRDRDGRLGSARYAADHPAYGGPRLLRIRVRLTRRPKGRIGRFVITGRSSARDSFRLRLR